MSEISSTLYQRSGDYQTAADGGGGDGGDGGDAP